MQTCWGRDSGSQLMPSSRNHLEASAQVLEQGPGQMHESSHATGTRQPPIVLPPWCPRSVPSIPRWLNTLGLLASQGIDVVVRHSFLDHGHNHLVDQNFNPLPVGLPRNVVLGLASPCTFGGVLSLWRL